MLRRADDDARIHLISHISLVRLCYTFFETEVFHFILPRAHIDFETHFAVSCWCAFIFRLQKSEAGRHKICISTDVIQVSEKHNVRSWPSLIIKNIGHPHRQCELKPRQLLKMIFFLSCRGRSWQWSLLRPRRRNGDEWRATNDDTFNVRIFRPLLIVSSRARSRRSLRVRWSFGNEMRCDARISSFKARKMISSR